MDWEVAVITEATLKTTNEKSTTRQGFLYEDYSGGGGGGGEELGGGPLGNGGGVLGACRVDATGAML